MCEWGWDIYHWMPIPDAWGLTVSILFLVCLRGKDGWVYWLGVINQMIKPYRVEMSIPLDRKDILKFKHSILSMTSAFLSLLVRDYLQRICSVTSAVLEVRKQVEQNQISCISKPWQSNQQQQWQGNCMGQRNKNPRLWVWEMTS